MPRQPTIPDRKAWRSSLTTRMDTLPRPVYFRSYVLQEETHVPEHEHPFTQFLFAREGHFRVEVAGRNWMIPTLFGIWIPEGVPHKVMALQNVWLESLDIAHPAVTTVVAEPQVVQVTHFVREFIHHASETVPELYDEGGAEGRLVQVLLDLLQTMTPVSYSVPVPHSPRLAAICQQMLSAPENDYSLKQIAAGCGMSERTFSRHFLAETGVTFGQWKRKMRLLEALVLLRKQRTVTEVAYRLGYSSAAAFSYAFKQAYGCPPLAFIERTPDPVAPPA